MPRKKTFSLDMYHHFLFIDSRWAVLMCCEGKVKSGRRFVSRTL
jgi:hypothetical protein